MWWVIPMVALAGCQLVFPLDDDPDEDRDGEPDVADNCPNLPNAEQIDGDGDGVGDACDPDTGLPVSCKHEIALFDAFDRDDLGEWTTFGGAWTIGGGKLSVDTVDDAFAAPISLPFHDSRLLAVATVVRLDRDPNMAQPNSTISTASAATLTGFGISSGYLCNNFYRHDTMTMVVHLVRFGVGPSELLMPGDIVGSVVPGDSFVLVQDDAGTGARACSFEKPPPAPASGSAAGEDPNFATGVIGIGAKLAAIDFESVVVIRQLSCP